MKILSVAFENINSLEGAHQIDFAQAPFSDSGLFVITGATGSGKSTILDVITLALYSQTPRTGKITKNEILQKGAVLTRGQHHARAEVTYACPKGIFRSVWSIRKTRTGNLQEYEMFLYDAQGKVLNQKKSEVPQQNQSLIGLDYSQFIKSVMLAQGDFARFLKEGKNERYALLEQITGNDIYRRIGMQVYEKYKTIEQQLSDWEKQVTHLKDRVLLRENRLENQQKLRQVQAQILQLEQQNETLKKQIQHKEQLFAEAQKIQKITAQKQNIEQQLEEFLSREGVKYQQHKRTQSIAEPLQELRTWEGKIADFQAQERQSAEQMQQAQNQQQKLWEEVSELVKKPINAENLEAEVKAFHQEIIALERQREEKLSEYKMREERLKLLLQRAQITEKKEDKVKEICQQAQQTVRTLSQSLTQAQMQQPSQVLEELKNRLETVFSAEKMAQKILFEEKNKEEKQKKFSENEQQAKSFPEKIALSEQKYQLLAENLSVLKEKIQLEKLRQSLEQHRKDLHQGQPCPLCGSLQHPYAEEDTPPKKEIQTQLSQQEKALNQQFQQLTEQQQQYKILLEQTQTLQGEIESLEQNLSAAKAAFQKAFPEQEIAQNWEEKIQKIKKQISHLELFRQQQEIAQVAQEALPIFQEIRRIKENGIALRQNLEERTQGKDIHSWALAVAQQSAQWQSVFSQASTSRKQASEQLENTQKSLKNLWESLQQKVSALGFESIEQAQQSRLSYADFQRLEQQFIQLENTLKDVQGQLSVLQKNYNILLEEDVPTPKEDLEESLALGATQLQQFRGEDKEISSVLSVDKQFRQEKISLEKQIRQQRKDSQYLRILRELIGDKTGQKFNNFAQDLTLRYLLSLANKRLSRLSPRYLLAQPNAEEDDTLVAIDKDMGGQRRSVKTLSGGETFILSLALALGLSDLASENVQINSLFIDEGFGTLDPETLDQILDTLERLQQESNKMIGLISHVESLKERIRTQIVLKQNGSGHSTLSIKS